MMFQKYQLFNLLKKEKGLNVWRYYGIGAGVFHLFSSKWSFIGNIKEKQAFIECLQRLKSISKKVNNMEVKPRKDHQLCSEIFCTERGCIDTFEMFEQVNEHILNGIHHIPKVGTSYDHVKKSFTN